MAKSNLVIFEFESIEDQKAFIKSLKKYEGIIYNNNTLSSDLVLPPGAKHTFTVKKSVVLPPQPLRLWY